MEIHLKSARSHLFPLRRKSLEPRALTRLVVVAVPIILLLLAMVLADCGGSTGVTQGGSTEATTGAAAPKAGATFNGPVEISGKASSAVISLVVSDDGASISSVGVTLNDLKTESFSAGSMTKQVTGSIPIKDGSFSGPVGGLGTIEGTFTSATAASGTVTLNLEIPFSTATADLGQFNWSAEAGEPGSSTSAS